MRRLVAILVLLILPSLSTAAEPSWSRELKRELVRVEDGELRYEDHALCRFDPPEGSQRSTQVVYLRTLASGPADTISRDQFIYTIALSEAGMLMAIADPGTYACKPLLDPKREPDITMAIEMTDQGYSIRWTDHTTGKTTVNSTTWPEVFPDP